MARLRMDVEQEMSGRVLTEAYSSVPIISMYACWSPGGPLLSISAPGVMGVDLAWILSENLSQTDSEYPRWCMKIAPSGCMRMPRPTNSEGVPRTLRL